MDLELPQVFGDNATSGSSFIMNSTFMVGSNRNDRCIFPGSRFIEGFGERVVARLLTLGPLY